jgi:YkoY family integral membrane protein
MNFPLAAIDVFGQKAEPHDLVVIALLVVLEGVLSIDNALVLGLLAKRLPKHLQGRALTYGLVGALVFRMAAIGAATFLLQWTVAKLLGGGYLVYVAVKHFCFEGDGEKDAKIAVNEDGKAAIITSSGAPISPEKTLGPSGKNISAASMFFWYTVVVIELTDIAFAIDSILAAIALVGQQRPHDTGVHDKLWVVIVGGFIGVVVMRFAAVLFIRLLEKFPRFELSAYLLVLVIGGKLLADWGFNSKEHPHRVDFHDYTDPAFWIFWVLMVVCFSIGFLPKREKGRFPVIIKEKSS